MHVCRATACLLVACRPLAGTRRRGRDLEEDIALEKGLLADEKECSEHVMLVDLGRNDVGKVAQMGSVSVDKLMEIERYSHVMHISSTVTGKLLPELNAWDVMRAALPAGTVSGAPKVCCACVEHNRPVGLLQDALHMSLMPAMAQHHQWKP